MRYSKQREMVYSTLCSTKSHPDANWVYSETKKVMPNISLGTVYRNLSELVGEKRVVKLVATNGIERYDADTSSHTHFVCEHCGAITDLEHTEEVCEVAGCEVSHCVVLVYGKCSNCINK